MGFPSCERGSIRITTAALCLDLLESPPVPLEASDMILIFLITTLAATLQAAIGFGMALIAAPLLLVLYPPLIPGPLMGAGLLLTGLVAYEERSEIDFSGVKYAVIGRLLGTALAALFLTLASTRVFNLSFGGLVFLGVMLSWAGFHISPRPLSASLAGFLSGLMGTISSIGGPPMALLYQHSGMHTLRATLAAYFVLGTSISLLALGAIGYYGPEEVRLTLLLTPAMLAGFLLAKLLEGRISDGAIRPLILSLSLLAGAFVIWQTLVGFS